MNHNIFNKIIQKYADNIKKESRTYYAAMWYDWQISDYPPVIYHLHDTWDEAFNELLEILKDEWVEITTDACAVKIDEMVVSDNKDEIVVFNYRNENGEEQYFMIPTCGDEEKGWSSNTLKNYIRDNEDYEVRSSFYRIIVLDYGK